MKKLLSLILVCCFIWPFSAASAGDDGFVVEGSGSTIGIYRDEMTDKIEQAIFNGCLYLKKTQAKDGSWSPPDKYKLAKYQVGTTAMILMGLLYCGVNVDSPTVKKGLIFLARNTKQNQKGTEFNCTYIRSALLCTYVLSDPRRKNKFVKREIDRHVKWLLKAQNQNPTGLWRYNNASKDTDMSCIQFALEALRMADSWGYQIPRKNLEKAREGIWKLQHQKGGWSYNMVNQNKKPITKGSPHMTAAATACLAFLDAALARPRKGITRRDPHITSGLKAMDRLFKATDNHYRAYSFERGGILTGTRFFGKHDWYKECATMLLERQTEKGNFHAEHHMTEHSLAFGTGFALLFLGKGLAPTIVGKLDFGQASQATAWDMRNLTDKVGREIGGHLNWINIPIESSIDEYMKVPLIYITSTGDPYDKLIKHKAKFTEYLNKGGTILGTGFENSEEFEEGFKKFTREIQPDSEFEELETTHPIYKRWHKIRKKYGLYAINSKKGNRALVLLLSKPFATPLATRRGNNVKKAMQLGTNIIIALTQIDKKDNKLDRMMNKK